MDEMTRQRLERINERNLEIDQSLQYADYYWRDKLNLTFDEILTYGWTKGREGGALSRTKEMFLSDVVDRKIGELELKANKMDIDTFINDELEKYNY
jgi:hypothetical protein